MAASTTPQYKLAFLNEQINDNIEESITAENPESIEDGCAFIEYPTVHKRDLKSIKHLFSSIPFDFGKALKGDAYCKYSDNQFPDDVMDLQLRRINYHRNIEVMANQVAWYMLK